MYILEITILVIFVILSAFFSASETAFTNINKIKLKHLVKEEHKNAALVEKLVNEPNKLIGSILICNNIVNIGASALATSLMMKIFKGNTVAITTGIMTLIILIFGEVTPKNLAIKYSEEISTAIAPLINAITYILNPIVIILTKISNVISRLFGSNEYIEKPFITSEELKTIVDVSNEEGVLEKDEKDMIYNIFEFGDMTVADVMVQRMDIVAIDSKSTYDEVIEVFKEKKLSRIPVYEETIDEVIGFIYVKDLFLSGLSNENFELSKLMRPPFNTYEFIKMSDFFKKMQVNKIHIATVLDEYGGVAGIITMEDVIESIVGDIYDEYDETENDITVVKEGEYIINANAKLSDIEEETGLVLESEDFESLGGFIIDKVGEIPKKGEVIEYHGYKFIIIDTQRNKINKIKIVKNKE